jgi:flagellar biosynthesis protein FliR
LLTELLNLDIFRFFLVVSRIGSAMMLLPGIGGQLVSSRIRLLLALSLSFLLLPVLAPGLPALPKNVGTMVLLVGGEIAIGLFMGTMVQLLMTALNLAGTFVSFQVGLTNAFSFDPVAEQQSQLLTGFLSNLGLVVLFTTDLHHLMLRAVVDSYVLFKPGQVPPFGDFAETMGHMLSESFRMGMQLAAPLVVFGLVFFTGLGVLSKLVPQMQVFFVSQPVQLIVGLWLFMVSLPAVMLLFMRFFEDGLIPFVAPR